MRLATVASILAALLVTAAGSAMAVAAESDGAPVVKIEPRVLERSLFSRPYQTVVITGTCPEKCEVVVKVISPTRDFKLNKAGKSLGFVWVPSGHAEVTEIPVMYAVLSSAKISSILSPAEQERAGLCPDFRDVYQQAKIRFEKDPPRDERASTSQRIRSRIDQNIHRRRALSVPGRGRKDGLPYVYGPAGLSCQCPSG